jgi:hypothetical protein
VTPEELRSALRAGQAAQLDQAVKDGTLTQKQADEIKKRQQDSGLVLGGGPGGRGGHHGGPGGRGGGREMGADVAKALGLTQAELREQVQDGKTIAEIAKAKGKDLNDVKGAVKQAAVARLDAKVKSGDITKAQRDEMAEHLDEHIARLGEEGPFGGRGPGHGRGGPGMSEHRDADDGNGRNENGSYVPPVSESAQTA